MAARYFWGKTKLDRIRVTKYIDLDTQSSAPAVAQGRMYIDSNGAIKFSADGTTFSTVSVS